MRGLYHTMEPFTPDSSGAIAVFADVPAVVVPIDMNGTVSVFRVRVGVEEGSPIRVCSALGSRELSYVLGDDEAFVSSFSQVVNSQEGELAVLVQGPVSSMVGVHVTRLAELLEQRVLKPVLAVDCSGSRFYDVGIDQALAAVFERSCAMMPLQLAPQPGSFNVLGLNSVDHNDVRMRWMLAEALFGAAGTRAVSYWGCFGGWQEWCYAGAAERNVVVSVSGAKLAQRMERRWGTPAVYLDEMGLSLFGEDTAAALRRAASGRRILVVGEQLMANVVRDALAGGDDAGAEGVTVASFFTMLADHRLPHDLRFSSEDDCERTLAEGAFDAVVADEVLRPLLPEGTAFYELPHSAVAAPLRRYGQDKPTALSEEWFDGLAQALGRRERGVRT